MKTTWVWATIACFVLAAPSATAQCQRQGKFTTTDILDKFGRGLSCGRGFVAASAPNDSTFLSQAGILHIYAEIAGTWQLEQTIQPATLNQDDLFGFSVAAGNGLVAASALFDDTAGLDSGAVYVFRRDPGGWVQEQFLTNPTPGAQLNYGRAIAMGGNVLAVAKWSPPAEVHVYRRSGTTWNLEATLTPSFTPQKYGTDVAVSGDRIVVGDPQYGIQEGAVEVYRFTAGVGWASEFVAFGTVGARLGETVDVHGDRFVTGNGATNTSGTGTLEVYRDTTGAGAWGLEQILVGNDTVVGDGFGYTVSISSSGVFAGAPGHDAVAADAGAVYGFTFGGGVWSQAVKRAPNTLQAIDNFGTSLDVTGSLMSVANRYQVAFPPDPKAVFVYTNCP